MADGAKGAEAESSPGVGSMGLSGLWKQIGQATAMMLVAYLFYQQFHWTHEEAAAERRLNRETITAMQAESVKERQLCRQAIDRVQEAMAKVQDAADKQSRAIQQLAVSVRKLAEKE